MSPVSFFPYFRVDIVVHAGAVRVIKNNLAIDILKIVSQQVVRMVQLSDRRIAVGSLVLADDQQVDVRCQVLWQAYSHQL